jgi:Tol biopolymer transport system component
VGGVRRHATGQASLERLRYSGRPARRTQRRTVFATKDWELDAKWSPDGSRILFTQFRNAGIGNYVHGDVYVMNAGGTNVRRLTGDPADDVAAGWSPDGRQILFTSDRNGPSQIFVMNLDRTHVRNLSGKRVDEFDPSWR